MKALLAATVTSLCLLAACAPATRVTLLSEAGTGAVVVQSDGQEITLDNPYEQADVRDGGHINTAQTNADSVKARYSELLSIQPPAPRHMLVYFRSGSAALDEGSLDAETKSTLTAAVDAAGKRPGGEIIVIGHTDTVGQDSLNDTLSLQRAQAMRDFVIKQGFDAERVRAVGRGARELAVPTAKNVAEARNRRVEIIIR